MRVLAGIGDEAGPALAEQIAAVTGLGWSAIELRTVGGTALADLDDAAFAAVAAALAEAGLDVVCVDSRIGDWSSEITDDFSRDLDELRVLARRCPELGARYVRVMSYPNAGLPEAEWERRVRRRLRELADRAGQADLVLLHENCAGWAGSDADRMLTLVGDGLGLLFDTGNGVAYGYSGVDLLAEVVDHVQHVHIKDGVSGPRWTLPGRGDADVAGALALLAAHGYTGALSLEPHLSLRPHERDGGSGEASGFHAAGLALEALLAACPAGA
ncbi:sugar phosphate isomerase/epimerase family protein [Actinokineospora sp. NPDC004072]